ncbi:MAG: heme lyase CcmF/NrfE family subunit [Aliivibrio sp.]|uniref:heme lyase CcmF/NrfE family subunit n=1 Tax=Aliivibrio sp. TaxID=1872443 RepID=UPI001A62230B|nr:heme lyase CcmF/NrfE family subunit [Aliivibrio sp.]
MLPEIAHFFLILGTFCSLFAAIVPAIGIVNRQSYLRDYAWSLSYAAFILISLSMILLAVSFSLDDFSITYIAQHSNSHLPIFFKIAAVWGGHEGSLLFWVFSLSGWAAAIALVHRKNNQEFISRVLIVLALLTATFGLFTLLASNPFERLFPTPFEGRDLNPMLQDVGLIFHPPLLYLGYVGFSAAFAFAVAALTMPDINIPWPKWSRSWTLAAWVMLTGGISLGSWWAYYELGWGGWWFWDPVENASLLPWLTGTALLHALITSEKRKSLINWSLLLSIFSFCLSLLGTFVVRSGVLTSVHAFAVDPSRGLIILSILAVCLALPLTLFMIQAPKIKPVKLQSMISKEVLILLGNGLLAVTTMTVLLGTFYPMIFQILGLGRISVGAPYFNAVFVPLALIAMYFMGFASHVQWGVTDNKALKRRMMKIATAAAMFSTLAFIYLGEQSPLSVSIVIFLSSWVLISSISSMFSLSNKKISYRYLSMVFAHSGVAITAIAAVLVSYHSDEVSSKMDAGSRIEMGGLTFNYIETKLIVGPNYTAEQAVINVRENDNLIATILPERRHYPVRVMNMSEPGIDWGWTRDLYITMGEKVSATEYAIRIQNKAFVRWIWIGSILMMIGGVISIIARIERRKTI